MRVRSNKKALVAGVAILIAALAACALFSRAYRSPLDGIPFSGAYLDADGGLLRVFLAEDDKFRTRKRLSEFPPRFIEAILLQEDRYFYSHWGINLPALAKAGWETYVKKSRRMGASTITMQLARLRYGLYTRTVPGKLSQILHAAYLELFFTKDSILEAYLNLVPCGRNIEGFPAASWYYFNRGIGSVDLAQTLLLCVIPQDPNARAPIDGRASPELTRTRKALFDAWAQAHPESADGSPEFRMAPELFCDFPFRAPHFTEYLEKTDASRGVETRTTISPRMQELCEETLERYIVQNRGFGVKNGAALLVDFETMGVLASVGSANYYDADIDGQVNGATAKRSPGSTLKPFIYALALEQGLIHSETMLKDTPMSFNEYTPDNFGSVFKGPVKAWEALVDSRNIPAIALARDIKNPDLYAFLKGAGVGGLKEREHYGLSIVLGSAEVSMMELARLYAAIANGGMERDLLLTDARRTDAGKRILTKESAYIVARMLERNLPPFSVRPQTSRGVPVAYKTGTSIGFKDCWSVAIFDHYVLCVWIGNFDGQGNNCFQGRTMAAPLLFNMIDSILATDGSRRAPAAQPAGVAKVPVCAVSGGIPGPDCGETAMAWFIPGVSPISGCKIHRKVYIDARTGYRTDVTSGRNITSAVREFWPTDILELFAEAGLPRLVPPPYPPKETRFDDARLGFPPDIVSPLANTEYVIRAEDDDRKSLVLEASADADATELFWFSGNVFIGRTRPREKLLWKPEIGTYALSVVDSKGRSDSIPVKVIQGE